MDNRYYSKTYGDEYYIFDSKILSEQEYEDNIEDYGYELFKDSMTDTEIVNKLNRQEKRIKHLEKIIMNDKQELNRYRIEEKKRGEAQLNKINI